LRPKFLGQILEIDSAMFWYIILNPAAANGAVGRAWPHIEQVLARLGMSYGVQFTTHRGHATYLAQRAIAEGHRYLLGVGGDGTHHEIVNGIIGQREVPPHAVHYALLPVGTGNDWARQYQLPRAAETRLRRLAQPQTRLQDVGLVEFKTLDNQTDMRYFANVAGLAYDGYVAHRMEQDGKSNNRLGYLLAVARYLFEYTPLAARITRNSASLPPVEDRFYTINVGICRYSGGGMQLVPHAVPDDGLLALTYARSMPRWQVLLQTPQFYSGSLLTHPRVTGEQVTGLRVDPLETDVPFWLEADGEFLGKAPAIFSLQENALRVVL
jgi:diacylglycerol kinase (ATP)